MPRTARCSEVVEVQGLGVLPARRDRDDPRRRASAEQWQEAGRSGRTARPPAWRASSRCRPGRPSVPEDGAGVVDDDVQSRFGREDRLRSAARTDAERTHVRDDDREPVLAVAGDELVAHDGQALLAPPDQDDPGSGGGEFAGGLRDPSPDVGPVISTVRPSSAPARPATSRTGRGGLDNRWSRSCPTTVTSSRSSMTARGSTPGSFPIDASRGDPSDRAAAANQSWTTSPGGTHDHPARADRDSLPIDEAFAYVADFANSQEWDPGVATAERLDPGPVGVGSRYRLGVRMGGRVAPMEYRISVFEPPTRVVLTGSGSGVTAVDDIRFEPIARRDARRLHRRHQARRRPRAHPAVARARVRATWPGTPSVACSGRSTVAPRRPEADGREGRHRRRRRQRPDRCLCPARHPRDPPVRRASRPWAVT